MENKKSADRKERAYGDRAECAGITIKTRPMFSLNTSPYIPCNWSCCACMPLSSGGFVNDDLREAKSINILNLPYASYTGIRSIFCDVFFVITRNVNYSYKNINHRVLDHPRIERAISIASLAAEQEINNQNRIKKKTGDLMVRLKEKTKRIFNNMAASFRVAILKLTGWLLYKFLRHILTSLTVHKGQLYVLKQMCKKDVPVLLLPTHKSHLDYILLSFILFNYHIKLPYVAAGDNLKIPVFQDLMKSYGGFFIRRTMDSSPNKDHIYRAVLKTYVEEMMAHNEMLEFFIEGGRGRGGKILHPRTGLLSYVVDAYIQGLVKDILIVPVSISYERLIEGDFISEQLGKPKVRESFIGTLLNTLKALNRCHGNVRVDFAQAFSIKEFFSNPHMNSHSSTSFTTLPSTDTDIDHLSTTHLTEDPERTMVNKLALHIAYEQFRNISISSTNLLSWILLYKTNRNEVTGARELRRLFEQYKEEVLYKGHFVNVSGTFQNILEHSVRMLKPHVEYNRQTQEVRVRERLESVIYLTYYANTLNMVYALDAVIATAIVQCYSQGYKNNMLTGLLMKQRKIEEKKKEIDNNNNNNNSSNNNNINGKISAKIFNNNDNVNDKTIMCNNLQFSDNKVDYRDIVANNVRNKINLDHNVNHCNGDSRNINADGEGGGRDGGDDGRSYGGDDGGGGAGRDEINLSHGDEHDANITDDNIKNDDDDGDISKNLDNTHNNNSKKDNNDDDGDDDDDDESDFHITFYKKEVLRTAMELAACLKYEFLFTPPCKKLDQTITEAFCRVTDANNVVNQEELIVDEEDSKNPNRRMMSHQYLDMQLENTTESDEVFVVRRASYESLRDQARPLQPILQSYAVIASHLPSLLLAHQPEKEFITEAQKDLKNRFKSNLLVYGESACFETISNFMKVMADLDVTTSYQADDIKMVMLNEDYAEEANLHNLISHFLAYSSVF